MLTAAYREFLKLRKSQWWDGETLRKLQWQRTRELIAHAYENVPFYRSKFDQAGIKPGDIRSAADMPLIPPCDKNELREAYVDGWQAKNYPLSECVGAVTSGSTGEPLKFYLDRRSLAFRFALNLRTLEFSDYRLGKKLFQVSPPLSGKLGTGAKTKFLDMAMRRLTIPPFEQDMEEKLKLLVGYRPSAIVGYTSYIKSLADLAAELPAPPRIESIMTTSEKLLDQTREKLGRVFGGRVFDQYGSVESGRSATECGEGRGYHINTEGVLIEIINEAGGPAGPGETGEVFITNLMNYVNPFIRYRVGDMAAYSTIERCACGRESPLLKEINGRLNDVIIMPDGRRIMPEYFYLTVREIKGLNQFQIVQTDVNALLVRYMAEGDLDEDRRLGVEREYRDYMPRMNVTWERVGDFENFAGKHKHIIGLDVKQ